MTVGGMGFIPERLLMMMMMMNTGKVCSARVTSLLLLLLLLIPVSNTVVIKGAIEIIIIISAHSWSELPRCNLCCSCLPFSASVSPPALCPVQAW